MARAPGGCNHAGAFYVALIIPKGTRLPMMDSRILAFLIGVVLGLLFMYAGASEAFGSIEDFSSLKTGGPSGKGPHNENGNTTLDIFKGRAQFHGHLEAAMDAFYEADTGVAPRPRIVGRLDQADVWVRWRDCSEGGANFVHYPKRIDIIHIGRCATNPTWVLSHEMNGHGESLTHYQGECYPGLSIMCHKRWEDGHLTPKDQYDLRHVPNQRLDSTPSTTLEEVR